MALASEPVCICGVDVAAPRQLRRAKGESAEIFFAHFKPQFTPPEVGSTRRASAPVFVITMHFNLEGCYCSALLAALAGSDSHVRRNG